MSWKIHISFHEALNVKQLLKLKFVIFLNLFKFSLCGFFSLPQFFSYGQNMYLFKLRPSIAFIPTRLMHSYPTYDKQCFFFFIIENIFDFTSNYYQSEFFFLVFLDYYLFIFYFSFIY